VSVVVTYRFLLWVLQFAVPLHPGTVSRWVSALVSSALGHNEGDVVVLFMGVEVLHVIDNRRK
jgi:hypothetical protein